MKMSLRVALNSFSHLLVFCLFCMPSFVHAQVDAQNSQNDAAVPIKKSIAVHFDSKLNEQVLHTTTLSYALPFEIESIMDKCENGEIDDCFFSLKAFENAQDKLTAVVANEELALLSLQKGQTKQAISYISKATDIDEEDPFARLLKGWILLSAGYYKKAKASFNDLLYLTADFELVSSAKLGTSIASYLNGKKQDAIPELQYLYSSDPYTISFVSFFLGKIARELKISSRVSKVFLQQALSYDANNYAAVLELAKIAEKEKNYLRAWQYYSTLYSLDLQDKTIAKKVKKYSQKFDKKANDYLFYVRLDQPIVHELPSVPSPLVRMGLYSNKKGILQSLQNVDIMGSGSLIVSSEKKDDILTIPSYIDKSISFNPETAGVDLKDAGGHIEFSSRNPFYFKLVNSNKTLLVHNIKASDMFSANYSDKELKGSLLVIPQQNGFTLVNKVNVEDLIPALLATRIQDAKHSAALEALAVVFRSALLERIQKNKSNNFDITDNEKLFEFRGINLISMNMVDATRNSLKIQLTQAEADFYHSCGVVTSDSIKNTNSSVNYQFSLANVAKYMISNPPADLYSKPQDPTQWADIKWLYWLDAKSIENRLMAIGQKIGKLRAVIPTKYSPFGRVLSVQFVGSKSTYESHDVQEIIFILSAGTLRSNFFSLIPMYKGKNIKAILVYGYDTGEGKGLCLNAAEGLAKKNNDYMAIIKYYFPNARILNTTTGKVY